MTWMGKILTVIVAAVALGGCGRGQAASPQDALDRIGGTIDSLKSDAFLACFVPAKRLEDELKDLHAALYAQQLFEKLALAGGQGDLLKPVGGKVMADALGDWLTAKKIDVQGNTATATLRDGSVVTLSYDEDAGWRIVPDGFAALLSRQWLAPRVEILTAQAQQRQGDKGREAPSAAPDSAPGPAETSR